MNVNIYITNKIIIVRGQKFTNLLLRLIDDIHVRTEKQKAAAETKAKICVKRWQIVSRVSWVDRRWGE